WPAVVSLGCWLVLTIGGNQLVSQGLASSLESRYQSIDVFGGEPFDTVVVLGGGTTTNLNGQAALANSGDRVALAARLFHAGQVKQIICTGSQTFRSTPNDLHPREEAAEILLGLGVPQSALLQMRGDNTSQEMSNLKKWLDENDAGSRIGLLTSAWHLPRAIRLAESQGLSLLPVPADFATEHYAPTPNLVVPSAQNLLTSARILKEYLARIVNR
ncbi:MAG: uncharacterized SAM-binding protein YcdF (DUF218 family), partial [Mariniblastus sp.]